MTADSKNDLGKILKQRRLMAELSLHQLGIMSEVSSSHLYRIEQGERFPSARILRKMAKPLGFSERELLTFADYLSPQSSSIVENPSNGQLDPYVARVLAQESVEVQRAVLAICSMLKYICRSRHSFTRFGEGKALKATQDK